MRAHRLATFRCQRHHVRLTSRNLSVGMQLAGAKSFQAQYDVPGHQSSPRHDPALSSRGSRRAIQFRQRGSAGRSGLLPWPLAPLPSQSAGRRGNAEGHLPGRRRVRREASAREDLRAYPSNAADHRGICRTSRGRSPAYRATEPGRASRHTRRRRTRRRSP
jgi:hypothetical protein